MSQNSFSDFYKSLLELVKSFEEKQTMLKVESDLDSHLVKIFGEGVSSLSRAKNGLSDVSELAFTTAEHHPYWGLLYHCAQIAKISLDKWDDDISKEELDEIEWSIAELKNMCKKLKEDLKDSQQR